MLNSAEDENLMHSKHISLKIYFYKNGLKPELIRIGVCKTQFNN